MELLVLLAVVVSLNLAGLFGWTSDSRDNQNWNPTGGAPRARQRRAAADPAAVQGVQGGQAARVEPGQVQPGPAAGRAVPCGAAGATACG